MLRSLNRLQKKQKGSEDEANDQHAPSILRVFCGEDVCANCVAGPKIRPCEHLQPCIHDCDTGPAHCREFEEVLKEAVTKDLQSKR